MNIKEVFGFKGVYEVEIRKKDGTLKKLWQENKFGRFLFDNFRLDLHLPFITGNFSTKYVLSNLVVNGGLAGIMDRTGDVNTIAAFTYIALGSGNTAAAATDTALQTELTDDGFARTAATVSLTTTTTTNDTLQLSKQFTFTGSVSTTVNEVGIFNASSSGTMLSRSVLTTGKSVDTSGETITVTYKLIASRA